MKRRSLWICLLHLLLAMLLALPAQVMAGNGQGDASKKLSQEELAQLLAPIALYPDELVSQILMASTYPLEVVQADRWAKSHKQSADDVLAKQLEKEPWDPSVKSLVSFPTVLASMSEKLDITTKIGDAFLTDQKGVMETIQVLRKKAQAAGNLKTSKEQQVIVEKEVIIIKSADPQVIYVPTYSPTVVYGTWMYPSYPPYYYYPPPPPYAPAYTLAAGIAIGAAWHNGSGHCDWHGNTVNVNNNYNINRNQNTNINRGQGGQSAWKHNPEHRKGVAYKDGATAKQYGQSPARSQQGRSESRGYGSGGGSAANRPSAGTMDRGAGTRPSAGNMDRGAGGIGERSAGAMDRGGRNSAFSSGSGSQARAASDRGMSSRQSFAGGGGGGRSFGGGGGGRGGGGRR